MGRQVVKQPNGLYCLFSSITPKQQALITYNFIKADIEEGLYYSVDSDMYNDCMEALESDSRVDRSVSSRLFEEDFRKAWNNLPEEEREKFV